MALPLVREFRLSPAGSGKGVCCDSNGAFVDSIPLLKRTRTNERDVWEPRDVEVLSKEITARYGLPIDISRKAKGLAAIARALNAGNVPHAQLVTLHLQIPEPPRLGKCASPSTALVKFIRELHWSGLLGKVWEPNEHPRWPAGAPDSQGGQFSPIGEDTYGFVDTSASGAADELEIAANVKRIKTSTLIRAWEKTEGKVWPKDPTTGRNQVATHIQALGDGGTNDASNIKPMTNEDHIKDHKEKGDFSRWARRRGAIGPSEGSPGESPDDSPPKTPPQPKTAPQPAAEDTTEPFPNDPKIIDEMIMDEPLFFPE